MFESTFCRVVAAAMIIAASGCVSYGVREIVVSPKDPTTRQAGDPTDYGKLVHYLHEVRDQNGNLVEVYRYYKAPDGSPVLDGIRLIRRSEGDPGLIVEYKEGHVVSKRDVIVTGFNE